MTYETNSGGFVDKNGWINLTAWTGYGLNNLSPAIREPDEALTHCESIVAMAHDAACDPRSGGIAGTAPLAARCGYGVLQFRRAILPRWEFVRWLGDVPVSNVGSVDAWAADYREKVRRGRVGRLGIADKNG